MIFDLTVARLEREDADLGTVGQSIWKAVAAVDVFYVDEIADATGLLFDHARQDTQWGETTAGEGSLSKQIAFEAAWGDTNFTNWHGGMEAEGTTTGGRFERWWGFRCDSMRYQ